ncbi:hypothetical protein KQI86_17350 [Clostridium sp. MSJ-11]|uniref:Uncharacterized protein n=1 Tax=Clostridium mobile TaxID=2841512 RepID=A0ABS6ELJ1_9CLOT|nr:hypothetical protein [Clostridium mobile]MBU5486090.1 hypothetical protein [Clostridium mobile]
MAGIWNVNGVYDLNSSKIKDKISFQIGEMLVGRIVSVDELKNEVMLRLLDGWQFPAKLNIPLEFPPTGLLKFKVEGYEDGKIKLVIVNPKKDEENSNKDSLDDILLKHNIVIEKEEYPLLEKMTKHNIPLTKENISKLKTVVDFRNKILENPEEEEAFINKYLESRGIEKNSIKGEKVTNILKEVFNELKTLNEDDMLTLFENNIDLTEDNVEGFKNVFKGEKAIYKAISDIEKYLDSEMKNGTEMKNDAEVKNSEIKSKEVILEESETKKSSDSEAVKDKSIGKDINRDINKDINREKNLNDNKIDKNSSVTVANKENDNITLKEKEIISLDKTVIKNKPKEELWKEVKNEINSKLEEMKETLKSILDVKSKVRVEAYDKVIDWIKENVNNFKVYNTMSNEYYYMDIPLKLNKENYDCKLIIKDERKKGKKIDSKNVKIATSIKTVNMGTVDAFICVNNSNMNVDIKCYPQWTKVIDNGKDKMLNDLAQMGYNVLIKVEEKKEDFNIVNCREFFVDNNLGSINVKV